jgi:hypothetical protein
VRDSAAGILDHSTETGSDPVSAYSQLTGPKARLSRHARSSAKKQSSFLDRGAAVTRARLRASQRQDDRGGWLRAPDEYLKQTRSWKELS